ncbi:MAG: SpoIID/LytB domain-containing protein [Oscillospiraceae bacterium]|nr:SpoIID/LytB domain-containing protein [Oscillospiraceae bacterium]
MKRYIIWIGIVYMVLLLLPLPVLGKLNPDIKPPITSSNSTNKSSDKINEKNEESFRLLDTDTNIVYEVSVKDFVTGSVGAEMYPTYNTEALKAQAVASYTYYSVLKKRQKANPNTELRGADFADMVSAFLFFIRIIS